jgi:hypothetical protein
VVKLKAIDFHWTTQHFIPQSRTLLKMILSLGTKVWDFFLLHMISILQIGSHLAAGRQKA